MSENMSEAQAMRIAAMQSGAQTPSPDYSIEEIQYFHPEHRTAAPLPDAMIRTAYNPEQAFSNLNVREEHYLKMCTRHQELRARESIPPYTLTDDQDAELNAMEPIQLATMARSSEGFNIKQFTEQIFRGKISSPDAKHGGFRAFGRWRGARPE